MTINILQTITNTLTIDRHLIESKTKESFALTPAENKVFRNKKTGSIIAGLVIVATEREIENYEEIDDPRIKKA